MKIDHINEAEIISKGHSMPIKDTDTVRVYHGTSDFQAVYHALTYGLSGSTRASRRYSYEFNNNPYGLFVSPDFKKAKEFGSIVIEFHTKVKDLEAPVWPSGSFTVQGQMSGMFDDEEDRNKAVLKQRQEQSESPYDYIRDSDRPDVAYWLTEPVEPQALFVGELNPNSIRAIWLPKNSKSITTSYERISPKEFLKRFSKDDIEMPYGRVGKSSLDREKEREFERKIVLPREDIDIETFIERLLKEYKQLNRDKLINILKKNTDIIKQVVWTKKQYERLTSELKEL